MGHINAPKPVGSDEEVHISLGRKVLNLFGCIFSIFAWLWILICSDNIWTIDTSMSIILAEYCMWSNSRSRKRAALRNENDPYALFNEKDDIHDEKIGKEPFEDSDLDCLAAVVGFREDPDIFARALGSYLPATNCRFLLASVDGDDDEDMEMVHVFQKVYTERSAVVHFPVPLVQIALEMDRSRPLSGMTDGDIIDKCCALAKLVLEENNICLSPSDNNNNNNNNNNYINKLCIYQPHMHKKGVMFTSFIVSKVISDHLGLEYLWTSDSDSIISDPSTLTRTMSILHGSPSAAGCSTALSIHNKSQTTITRLGNSVFLNELHLSRCFSSAFGSNDCQSGPCAVFRTRIILPELLSWYKQTVLGHWMVVNEDRHLTTRLLSKGHTIKFVPDVFTATESPVNLRRWLLQQVRWARSVHIETFCLPGTYIRQPPIFFFAALRRQLTGLICFVVATGYFLTGTLPLGLKGYFGGDYMLRLVFTLLYLGLRNPLRPTWSEWLVWSAPANLFYNIPLPAVQLWSLMTLFEDSWGTSMRSSGELSRRKHSKLRQKMWEVGFFVVWMGILGGALGRYVATNVMMWGADGIWWSLLVGTCCGWSGFGYWMVVCD